MKRKVTLTNTVITAIRIAVREQVIKAYREHRNHAITTEEYGRWMHDIRITSLAVISTMESLGILDEDEEARLEIFIRSLTEVYF